MLRKTHFEFNGIPNTLAQKEQKAGSASGPKKNRLIGTRSVTCPGKTKEHLRDAECKSINL